jgi:hypothetical protein
VEARRDGRTEARTRVDGRIEAGTRVDGRIEARTRVDGRIEARTRVDGRVEAAEAVAMANHTPKGTYQSYPTPHSNIAEVIHPPLTEAHPKSIASQESII